LSRNKEHTPKITETTRSYDPHTAFRIIPCAISFGKDDNNSETGRGLYTRGSINRTSLGPDGNSHQYFLTHRLLFLTTESTTSPPEYIAIMISPMTFRNMRITQLILFTVSVSFVRAQLSVVCEDSQNYATSQCGPPPGVCWCFECGYYFSSNGEAWCGPDTLTPPDLYQDCIDEWFEACCAPSC
jgi:hypothetical protein